MGLERRNGSSCEMGLHQLPLHLCGSTITGNYVDLDLRLRSTREVYKPLLIFLFSLS